MKKEEFIEDVQRRKPCCADTACTLKIYRHFRKLATPSEVTRSEDFLSRAISQGILCMTGKGGSESTVIEMIFSICRMLGLRLGVAM